MNDQDSRKPDRPLRKGWTTGACAAAAAKAAFEALLSGHFSETVTIRLPRGERPSFPLADCRLESDRATAAIVKDAGDDPDVTHGALIRATVSRIGPGDGVVFRAGDGVGTVTRAGLPIPPGEPAINPGPRSMIADALGEVAEAHDTTADVEVTISVPGGAELAEKTWNPRLGIVNGISILGTTGVVVPYSCSAWIHSIHRGIDVARASGTQHIAAATGRVSEQAVRARFDLPLESLIDMGDFVGGMLKYLRSHPVPRVTIAGGFAKLIKLAQGHMDLHSARSQVDFHRLAARAKAAGLPGDAQATIQQAASAGEVLDLPDADHLAHAIAVDAQAVAMGRTDSQTVLDILIVDRSGRTRAYVGQA